MSYLFRHYKVAGVFTATAISLVGNSFEFRRNNNLFLRPASS